MSGKEDIYLEHSFKLAYALHQATNLKDAQQVLMDVLASHPHHPQVNYDLGVFV